MVTPEKRTVLGKRKEREPKHRQRRERRGWTPKGAKRIRDFDRLEKRNQRKAGTTN